MHRDFWSLSREKKICDSGSPEARTNMSLNKEPVTETNVLASKNVKKKHWLKMNHLQCWQQINLGLSFFGLFVFEGWCFIDKYNHVSREEM